MFQHILDVLQPPSLDDERNNQYVESSSSRRNRWFRYWDILGSPQDVLTHKVNPVEYDVRQDVTYRLYLLMRACMSS